MHARLLVSRFLLPILYLALSLPVVLFQVFATPPFQVADEENHFLRAVQIADGHPIAHRLSDTAAGGELDANAAKAAVAFNELKFHPETKLDTSRYREIAALHWGEAEAAPTTFANTAIYPAYFYLPAALGIELGRLSGRTILDSFYLGRLFTALAATLISGLAIAICARGRSVLFVLLCLPMVLSLFAGIAQDALSLASCAIVVAVWSRYAGRDEEVPPRIRCCAALLLGAIIGARLPLIPLGGMLFLPTSSARQLFRRSWLSRSDLLVGLVALVPIAFAIAGAGAAKIAFRPDAGVSPSGQIAFLLDHPGAAIRVGFLTLQQWGSDYLHQMVGVLGWLDTLLPPRYYPWIGMWLTIAVAVECASPARPLSAPARALQWCFVAAAAAGVFGALYLAWTPVAAKTVDGVQGRYLLVPAICAILALPSLPLWSREPHLTCRRHILVALARMTICSAVAAANLWVVPITILHRYYGP